MIHDHAQNDDDGHGRKDVTIRAVVTKKESDLVVDLTESDAQSDGFLNWFASDWMLKIKHTSVNIISWPFRLRKVPAEPAKAGRTCRVVRPPLHSTSVHGSQVPPSPDFTCIDSPEISG